MPRSKRPEQTRTKATCTGAAAQLGAALRALSTPCACLVPVPRVHVGLQLEHQACEALLVGLHRARVALPRPWWHLQRPAAAERRRPGGRCPVSGRRSERGTAPRRRGTSPETASRRKCWPRSRRTRASACRRCSGAWREAEQLTARGQSGFTGCLAGLGGTATPRDRAPLRVRPAALFPLASGQTDPPAAAAHPG